MGGTRKSLIRVEIISKFNVMKKEFSKLELCKRTIAKMNDAQLSTVKGGNMAMDPNRSGCNITCQSTGVTNVRTAK